jgi:Na+-driven multidrug efflux pump
MPVVAAAVAVLPFVARLSGERDYAEIRRGLRQVMLVAAAYCVAVVTPGMLLGGGALARWLATAQATEHLTRVALGLVPLAVLAAIPFQLCRPAFEGLQRGRPGLVMAVIRYVGLTIPFGLGGMYVAERTSVTPIVGLLLGLALASAIASVVFLVWMERALDEMEARREPARAA